VRTGGSPDSTSSSNNWKLKGVIGREKMHQQHQHKRTRKFVL